MINLNKLTIEQLEDQRESMIRGMDIVRIGNGDTESLVVLAERIKEIDTLIHETTEIRKKDPSICENCGDSIKTEHDTNFTFCQRCD